MILHTVEQGTPEWFKLRAGIPTASELDALISPLWKHREGEGIKSYVAHKAAETILGGPLVSWSGSGSMEQGSLKEKEAVPFLEIALDIRLSRVGFVTTDDCRFGCSPDAVHMEGGAIEYGAEIKCPEPDTHVKYLLAGTVPKDYMAQVHGCMAVTGAKHWLFMSYCRMMPPLILRVERDEEVCRAILAAVGKFNAELDAAVKKIKQMEI